MQNFIEINKEIQDLEDGQKGYISDGYHTFNELYLHRTALLAYIVSVDKDLWLKSYLHSDLTSFGGMFVIQGYIEGKQVSYHIENEYRDKFRCKEVAKANERDGHTADDVVKRFFECVSD